MLKILFELQTKLKFKFPYNFYIAWYKPNDQLAIELELRKNKKEKPMFNINIQSVWGFYAKKLYKNLNWIYIKWMALLADCLPGWSAYGFAVII